VTEYIAPLLAGWIVCLSLVILFHLVWNDAAEEVRYALGAGAILIGCVIAGLLLDQAVLVVAPAFIASAGLIIPLIQHFERKADAAKKRAQKNGEIVGMARGLSQEIIDSGGRSGESGVDEKSRRN
jgi:hypothetical protein